MSQEEDAHTTNAPAFDGEFTESFRRQLHTRREDLGLTLDELGGLIHVEGSTLRKWESGHTLRCRAKFIRRIRHFLDGEYDHVARARKTDPLAATPPTRQEALQREELPLLQCLDQAAALYHLCKTKPGLRQKLLERLQDAIRQEADCLQSAIGQNHPREHSAG